MYKDMEKKIQYYKEQITRELLKNGLAVNSESIQRRLNSIDTRLAIFKHHGQYGGKEFDTQAYKKEIEMVLTDLKILYEILHETIVKEYNDLILFAETHLNRLESTAEFYEKQAEYETKTTTLGKTLFFQHNNFDILEYENSTTINLGKVQLTPGSRIACFANINNVLAENIVFKFKEKTGSITVAPYNYNKTTAIVPGEIEKNTYSVSLSDSQLIISNPILNIGVPAKEKSDYIIYAGQNKISYRNKKSSDTKQIEKDNLLSNVFSENHIISFVTLDTTKVEFLFNKNPLYTNFKLNSHIAENIANSQNFIIETGENFAMDFKIDKGKIFAEKRVGIVTDEKLYYPTITQLKDFYIVEYPQQEAKEYNVTIEIDGTKIEIDNIAIKELDEIGGINV